MIENPNLPTLEAVRGELSRRHLTDFAATALADFSATPFHRNYYRILERFARGQIRRLIITVPPQHGKSLGSSVLLPAYLLGLDPDLKICIASYSLALAAKFNRQIQRIMDSDNYRCTFPDAAIKSSSAERGYVRNADEFEVIGHRGGVMAVGREGSLTGNRVDVMILDDLYKDAMEANSQLIRGAAWEWYTSVVKSRLHNRSRELIVFTRWHQEDL